MKLEVEEYAKSYDLTPREQEVFFLLANQVVHFKDLAAQLNLSPNTINNHLKSIFGKTGTNSKSELLGAFLKHVTNKLNDCKTFVRKPHVLVVDDDEDVCEYIAEDLTQRGMKVYSFTDPNQALEAISSMKLDTVVSDIRMPNLDGIKLLQEIRKTHRYFPSVFFVSGCNDHDSVDQIMNMGAIGLLKKPIDSDQVFRLIIEEFIRENYPENPSFRKDKKSPIQLADVKKLSKGSVGFGGIFLALNSLESASTVLPAVGSLFQLKFSLEDQLEPIKAVGEVVWARTQSKTGLPAGIGLKFIEISTDDRERVHDYVRTLSILSYIPLGPVGAVS